MTLQQPPTAAQDTVLRFALGMYAIDPASPCTPEQRAWIAERLQSTAIFTAQERGKVRAPLLAWYNDAHPRSAAIVAAQFPEET